MKTTIEFSDEEQPEAVIAVNASLIISRIDQLVDIILEMSQDKDVSKDSKLATLEVYSHVIDLFGEFRDYE